VTHEAKSLHEKISKSLVLKGSHAKAGNVERIGPTPHLSLYIAHAMHTYRRK